MNHHEKRIFFIGWAAMLVTILMTFFHQSLTIWSYTGLGIPFLCAMVYMFRQTGIRNIAIGTEILIIVTSVINAALIFLSGR